MSNVQRRDDERPDRRRVPRGGRRPGDRSGRHPTILVADGYQARVPYVRYLERYGFHVEEAIDGEQALARINTNPPHVILADRALPVFSAAHLSHWLAQSFRTRRIPLILMAGSVDPRTTAGEPPMGALAGVLVKPFQLAAMLEEVRRVLRTQASL